MVNIFALIEDNKKITSESASAIKLLINYALIKGRMFVNPAKY